MSELFIGPLALTEAQRARAKDEEIYLDLGPGGTFLSLSSVNRLDEIFSIEPIPECGEIFE